MIPHLCSQSFTHTERPVLRAFSLLAMAFVSNSQFCDDIDRLIMEEENRMNNVETSDESATNYPPDSKETKKPRKKRPYKRYTPEQVKGLQEVFERKRHPDEDERKTLGQELGLTPLRVKFWFQNRRSLTKKQNEKDLNKNLKEENEKPRLETLANAACHGCGAPTNAELLARVEHYKAANDTIKNQMWSVMEKIFGKGAVSRHLNSTAASASAGAAGAPQEAEQRADIGPSELMFGWNDEDEA